MPSNFKFSISLNIINHLGINIYSNVPAVISEIVANEWDAEATVVDINIDKDNSKITINDNGHGMTEDDLNNKFLCVGYQKRHNNEAITPKYKRPVMGRKGIGKLSLFSIARVIEVHSIKNGQSNGLVMNSDDIQAAIKKEGVDYTGKIDYSPTVVPNDDINISEGTKIKLSNIRKNIKLAHDYIRIRVARRFSIIGKEYNFQVNVNGTEITVQDRNYFKQLQYIWTFGNNSDEYSLLATNATNKSKLDYVYEENEKKYQLSGWIGTFKEAGNARTKDGEVQNKISILIRGKMAQDDILQEFNEAGQYANYLIGEIEADLIDADEEKDVATSSRQNVNEDDPRYISLKSFVRAHLKTIQSQWTGFRNKEGADAARLNPVIKEWCDKLKGEYKKRANHLFGKINQMTLSDDEKNQLFIHAIIAFESSKHRSSLDNLEMIATNDLSALIPIFENFDDIEAGLYYQITSERVDVINALKEKVDENQKEKVIQKYLFNHLWLLDPAWERATGSSHMEEKVITAFDEVDKKILTDAERNGRLDIRYKAISGKHIIIELKRPSVATTINSLVNQVDKYKDALSKCLDSIGKPEELVEVVCVLGKHPSDWNKEQKRNSLNVQNIRVVLYDELIEQAYNAYSAYMEKSVEVGKLSKLLDRLRKQSEL